MCCCIRGETAGIFGNNKKLIDELENAGRYYEKNFWELPITSKHEERIKEKNC